MSARLSELLADARLALDVMEALAEGGALTAENALAAVRTLRGDLDGIEDAAGQAIGFRSIPVLTLEELAGRVDPATLAHRMQVRARRNMFRVVDGGAA